MRILHDIHAGAIRSAGTTPATQWALRLNIIEQFKGLLPVNEDLMLLGDLFDTNNVPISDVLQMYVVLCNWMRENPECKLYNVNGNHDASKTSNVLSSFQFLGKLLALAAPQQYVHIEEPRLIPYGYVIPHCRNQEQFDIELAKVPECDYLFVHCNYDNHFAAQSDQSLNMSRDQVLASKARWVVFAHEHNGRDIGKVLVPGNQIASSVSDWLAERNKRFLSVNNDVYSDGSVTLVHRYNTCRLRENEFIEMDWDKLTPTLHKFVRVTGEADASSAAAAVNAINKFRRVSEAFVITNAVQVAAEDSDVMSFEASLTSVQQFSVMNALKELLSEEQMKVVESLC